MAPAPAPSRSSPPTWVAGPGRWCVPLSHWNSSVRQMPRTLGSIVRQRLSAECRAPLGVGSWVPWQVACPGRGGTLPWGVQAVRLTPCVGRCWCRLRFDLSEDPQEPLEPGFHHWPEQGPALTRHRPKSDFCETRGPPADLLFCYSVLLLPFLQKSLLQNCGVQFWNEGGVKFGKNPSRLQLVRLYSLVIRSGSWKYSKVVNS